MKLEEYGKENNSIIVMLHGANFVHCYGRQYSLANSFHIIVPHIMGFGDEAGRIFYTDTCCAELVNMIRSLNKKVLLVGFSLGAQLAFKLVSEYPELFYSAIIVSPWLNKTESSLAEVMKMNEKQFRKTFDEAAKMPGVHGTNFLILLESRLDNLVYRMGFATTRRGARQLVNHGHITVNGKKVDIPSYRVKPGSVIALKENSKDHKAANEALEKVNKRVEYVTFDENKKEGTYVRYPERNELNMDINESLIVEFYNK